MQYDILMYSRLPNQSWADVVTKERQPAAADPGERRALWQRIEDAVRTVLPDLELWTPDDIGSTFTHGELRDPVSGLRVELLDQCATVSFYPSSGSDRLDGTVAEVVRIVARESGYEPYDPQTGAAFDGRTHRPRL